MVRFVHSQSWPWQKPVQKEKVDLLHCVVRFCSSNLNCDRNLCKKKKLIFFLHCVVRFCSSNLDLICAKRKSWSFLLCGKICALPILTVTEICAKRKSWSLTLCGEILQFQSWPWQKSVQKEKVDFFFFLHRVVWFCSPNLDLDWNLCKKKKLIFFTLCGEILHSKCWPCQKSVQKEKILFYSMWCDFCTPNLDRDRNLCKQKKLISYTVWWDFAVPTLTFNLWISTAACSLFEHWWQRTVEQIKPISR